METNVGTEPTDGEKPRTPRNLLQIVHECENSLCPQIVQSLYIDSISYPLKMGFYLGVYARYV